MLKVKLPDGSVQEYSSRVRPIDVAADIGPRLAKATLAAEVDGQVVGLDHAAARRRRSAAAAADQEGPRSAGRDAALVRHVMARAVMRLFDGVQLAFGPTIDNGFYYDFDLEHPLSEDDFPAIEAEMAKIIKEDEPFERIEMSRATRPSQLCRDLGQTLKVEHIDDGLADAADRLVLSPGRVHRPVPRPAHAQRRGDRRVQAALGRRRLLEGRRLAPAVAAALRHRLVQQAGARRATSKRVEEAKRRDHRVLGKQLELFPIDPMVGSGLILWLPKGAIVRRELENFIRDELIQRGYQPVYTPHIGRVELYETSGHYPVLRRQPVPADRDGGRRALPAQADELPAPHHDLQVEAAQLPRPAGAAGRVRHGVSLRAVGRAERHDPRARLHPGRRPHLLHRGAGGRRVPRLPRDDPVRAEDAGPGRLPRAAGLPRSGQRQVRRQRGELGPGRGGAGAGLPRDGPAATWTSSAGEAAFYGPKADFVVTDCIGREWQLGTVQLDYNLPSAERFDLEYIGADNQPHRPVMIHRAPFGSLERFVGMLIEHFAGAFPLWLAPEQVRVLTVSEKFEEYGREVEAAAARGAACASTGDYRAEKIGAKIRDAQLELIPYMFVVGGREMAAGHRLRPRPHRRRPGRDAARRGDRQAAAEEIDARPIRQVARLSRACQQDRRAG